MTHTANSNEQNTLYLLKNIAVFARPYKLQVFFALIALIFTAAITLTIGQGIRLVIDQGFAQHSLAQLKYGVMFLISVTLLIAIGTFFRFYLVSWLGERMSADIRSTVFNHIISLHPHYFEERGSSEIMSRITTDTTLLQSIIGSSFSMALRSALMSIGAIIMLFSTNIKLSLIVLLAVPFVLFPILFFGRKVRALSRKSQDSIADVGSYAAESIEHIKTVQSYVQEHTEQRAFAQEVETAFSISKKRIFQRAALIAAVIIIVFSAITGMLWIGGRDVINGVMTGGDLAAFVFYAILVASSLATISEVIGELQRAAGATERLIELLNVRAEITAEATPASVPKNIAQLQFKNVTFNYPTRPEQAALKEVTFNLKAGQILALVGPSGAGKSTLFELLQRFYDPTSGEIYFNQTNIRDLSQHSLRQTMALVPQQSALFSKNVLENIRYGVPQASEEMVILAAKKAHAHEFISALPDGYYSELGSKGIRLSGGQKQRISIARAILKNPQILLLDEATSALDSESEFHVQQALNELMQNRTTLIIAHRLSTVKHADHIAVFDQGQLKDVGTHEQLLSRNTLYKRLVELQFNDNNPHVWQENE